MMPPLPAPLFRGTGWPWNTEAAQFDRSKDADLPKISIVTPSYNQGAFLETTIRSVLLQGYPRLEYIIMDGGSTDESVSIIRHYSACLTSWTSGPDGGQSAAINKGFSEASGDILAWLNSDDHYVPEALWTIADVVRAHPETEVFSGGSERLDANGTSLGVFMPPALTHYEMVRWRGYHLPQPSCFFRKRAWEKSGPLDETLYYLMDYDLWLRMSRDFRFLALDKVLSREIRHPAAKNEAKPAECLAAMWMIKMRYDKEVAAAEIADTLKELMRIQRRALAVTRSLPYRALRPLLKAFFPAAW